MSLPRKIRTMRRPGSKRPRLAAHQPTILRNKEETRVTINPHNIIPMVIESSPRGERAFDIYSLLLKGEDRLLGDTHN